MASSGPGDDMRPVPCVVSVAAHTGWAHLVCVAAQGNVPAVIERRRVALIDQGLSTMPYEHDTTAMREDEANAVIARVRRSIAARTSEALRRVVIELAPATRWPSRTAGGCDYSRGTRRNLTRDYPAMAIGQLARRGSSSMMNSWRLSRRGRPAFQAPAPRNKRSGPRVLRLRSVGVNGKALHNNRSPRDDDGSPPSSTVRACCCRNRCRARCVNLFNSHWLPQQMCSASVEEQSPSRFLVLSGVRKR